MAEEQSKALSKSDAPAEGEGQPGGKAGWLSWAIGWILIPGSIIGVIFGGGVLVGVHLHDSWFARLIVWFVELF